MTFEQGVDDSGDPVEVTINNLVVHEYTYNGPDDPVLRTGQKDVTTRTDGPFINKIYDAGTDTFSDPPEPEEEE